MELDWNLLECEIRSAAARIAGEVISDHPSQTFYGLALEVTATAPDAAGASADEPLRLPVLALNSEEAFGRDLDDEARQVLAHDQAVDDDADFSELDEPQVSDGFYSPRWDASSWHWCSMDLFDDDHAEAWNDRLNAAAAEHGWEDTVRRYYRCLIAAVIAVRKELDRHRVHLVAFVSDEEHAEKLLLRCLTHEQLSQHFPELLDLEDEVGQQDDDAEVEAAR
ncbi:DUF4303 domain-containing protein [Zhihengliuella flava]|uniref:DUF4303 domain-containing protein n=1 Tax=Zhihengliuella flava TaxID=1285193 RepID=A0A931GL22_9MICC|nr:DUF4303 domain-containing protein [Zhihengliuella flava]MBG6084049.1 hypothetical protein [Zhihengliuella flava]